MSNEDMKVARASAYGAYLRALSEAQTLYNLALDNLQEEYQKFLKQLEGNSDD